MRTCIGIDPGKGGGVAIITPEGEVLAVPMYDDDSRLLNIVSNWKNDPRCVIEHVGPMPGQGVTSMFSFGEQFGRVKMACVAANLPFELVRPQRWQKELGIRSTKKETYSERKRRFRIRAQELFPSVKVTLQTADALLLAEYCRRVFG